jgi:urease accessory protein UreF
MAVTDREKEWAGKASRFIKAEVKRAGIGYRELADRLNKHGLQETEDSIASKLARGTFAVTFFLATLNALELEGVRLEDL